MIVCCGFGSLLDRSYLYERDEAMPFSVALAEFRSNMDLERSV